jgi:hypothetical protein
MSSNAQKSALVMCPFTQKQVNVAPVLYLAYVMYEGMDDVAQDLDAFIKMLSVLKPCELEDCITRDHYALLYDLRDAFQQVAKSVV